MEKIFESQNIYFTKMSLDLVNEYLDMVNDYENVRRYISKRIEPYTLQEEIEFVNMKLNENEPIFTMIEKSTNEFIGTIEIMDIEGEKAKLGIAITSTKQNLGYGKESVKRIIEYAFNDLELKLLELEVYTFNYRGYKVYSRCGFMEYKRTEDTIFMRITKNFWLQNKTR